MVETCSTLSNKMYLLLKQSVTIVMTETLVDFGWEKIGVAFSFGATQTNCKSTVHLKDFAPGLCRRVREILNA